MFDLHVEPLKTVKSFKAQIAVEASSGKLLVKRRACRSQTSGELGLAGLEQTMATRC